MATKSIVQNDVMSNSSHFKGTSLAYWLTAHSIERLVAGATTGF
jgi:nicotinamidase-related amidase